MEHDCPSGAPHISPVTPAEDMRTVLINNISWGAVFAGVAMGLVTHLLLNLLGVGIAASITPSADGNPSPEGFSTAAGLWWVISGIVAALAGGIVAGRLSGRPKPSTAAWHGVTTWALTTLLLFWLVSTAIGSVVGGALSAMGSAAGGIGKMAAQTAAPMLANATDPFADITQKIQENTGGEIDPQAARTAAISAVRAALTGDPAQQQQAHDKAVQALAKAQNVPEDQASNELDQYKEQYDTAMEKAKQQAMAAVDAATKIISRAALFGFIALLLGGVAGWIGGRIGAVEPTISGDIDDRERYTAVRRS